MARVVVIGGIESTYTNAQTLYELGEEIAMFFTRGEHSPGWEGVAMIDASNYPFASQVPTTVVNGNINDHVEQIRELDPKVIYSLGWQQIFHHDLLNICPVIGIHESLLPRGAGPTPLANAILHDEPETGCTLFRLDSGMDTGDIICQLKMQHSPQCATSTELYTEAMQLGQQLLQMFVPHINSGAAPSIVQNVAKRTIYGKIRWNDWPEERVARAKTYPYA